MSNNFVQTDLSGLIEIINNKNKLHKSYNNFDSNNNTPHQFVQL